MVRYAFLGANDSYTHTHKNYFMLSLYKPSSFVHESVKCRRPLVFIVFILCLSTFGINTSTAATFDVTDFGAKEDGTTDDANAFNEAWNAFCGENSAKSTLVVPLGKTFFLSPMQFNGPCKPSKLYIQVLGNIVAPNTISGWIGCAHGVSWLQFSNITGLTIQGPGQFDGQGAVWWHSKDISTLCVRPTALHFIGCDGLQLNGTTHLNSPRQHIMIRASNNVDIGHLNISAPGDTHNTDGVDIATVSHVNIHNSSIGTGDDCVAINGGTFDINVTNVKCGPGHGISIGSLGERGEHETVEQVRVTNCNISDTQNGVRIKTVPGGSGYAKEILFEQIKLKNVKNPIIIDQHYCVEKPCDEPSSSSAVAVSSVIYRNIEGSSASQIAIKLNCSETIPCTNITMDHIDITGLDVSASCNDAKGTFTETSPNVSCF